jgi:LemA protein
MILYVMGAILVLLVLTLFFVISIYNRFVRLRNGMENSWAQIDVELKRRFDLIPNLVETAQGYLKHEASVLTAVTEARGGISQARKNGDIGAQIQAENNLTSALANLRMTMEQYPDLKGNTVMTDLMGQLTTTENQISGIRAAYNNTVLSMNNAVETFPSNIIAGIFNFSKGVFFEVDDEAERAAPKVSFG